MWLFAPGESERFFWGKISFYLANGFRKCRLTRDFFQHPFDGNAVHINATVCDGSHVPKARLGRVELKNRYRRRGYHRNDGRPRESIVEGAD